jgi:hypothetical protein
MRTPVVGVFHILLAIMMVSNEFSDAVRAIIAGLEREGVIRKFLAGSGFVIRMVLSVQF